MSNKEFTLQKGFILPVLKALTILNKKSNLKDIYESLISNNLFAPREGDEEKIDFNGIMRFEASVKHCLNQLSQDGFVVLSGEQYEITPSGIQKLSEEWPNYNQNDYIKVIDSNSKNKYVYYNIPPYLLFGGHRQLTLLGFCKHEHQYVKFLNDFVDYIDLNYPTMEEMINFLKYNYDFADNEQCLNAVNIIRSSGLSKVMGRNLSLTKLGQWYINSYSFTALFKIFASRYVGIEEIFNSIALGITNVDSLKSILTNQYNFDWADSEQLEMRLNWMEDLEIINRKDAELSLSDSALELAEYLGLIDLDIQKVPQKVVIPSHTEVEDKTEIIDNAIQDVMEEDFNFSYELDDIVDDLISDAIANEMTGDSADVDSEFIDEAISEIKAEKHTDEFKEPEFDFGNNEANETEITEAPKIVEPVEEEDSIFAIDETEFDAETSIEYQDESSEDFVFDIEIPDVEEETEEKTESPSVIHIPTKTVLAETKPETEEDLTEELEDSNEETTEDDSEERVQQEPEMYIKPEEISKLVNLPKDVINKIAAALNMGKHIILTGAHGSGKTSVAVVLAKIARQKGLNCGYSLASANEYWTAADTIGSLIEIDDKGTKIFKEGILLKSIRENKWLVIDEITKCDTYRCFNDFINALHGYNTILSYMHENYKNVEILSENTDGKQEVNQYLKNKDWRIIATMDTSEKHHMSFSPALIRRFAFIEISVNNYTKLIDEYFTRNNLQNDLLKTKVKSIFGENGLAKYKDIGASSLYDFIHYLSIRSKLMSDEDSIHDILAEGLELYIFPQLRLLDEKVIKDVQEYLLSIFEGNEDIQEYLNTAL